MYTQKTKQAVLNALSKGKTIEWTAKRFAISQATVSRWKTTGITTSTNGRGATHRASSTISLIAAIRKTQTRINRQFEKLITAVH